MLGLTIIYKKINFKNIKKYFNFQLIILHIFQLYIYINLN